MLKVLLLMKVLFDGKQAAEAISDPRERLVAALSRTGDWTGQVAVVSEKAIPWLEDRLIGKLLTRVASCDAVNKLPAASHTVALIGGEALERSKAPWHCVAETFRALARQGIIVLLSRCLQPPRPGENFRFLPGGLKALADAAGFEPAYADGLGSRALLLAEIELGLDWEEAVRTNSSTFPIFFDHNFYLESWFIGIKQPGAQIKFMYPPIGRGQQPICSGCAKFSDRSQMRRAPLGPGMLNWQTPQPVPADLKWDDPKDISMAGHIRRNTQPTGWNKCPPFDRNAPMACFKPTRLQVDRQIIHRMLELDWPLHGIKGQRILIVSPPLRGVELWGVALKDLEPQYAITIYDGRHHETCEALPFADQQFDQVWMSMVLEHTIAPWRCFEELYRTLKPGGVAVVTAPVTYHLHATHYPDNFRYLPGGLEALANASGFRANEVGKWGRRDFLAAMIRQDDDTNKCRKNTKASHDFYNMAQLASEDVFLVDYVFAFK